MIIVAGHYEVAAAVRDHVLGEASQATARARCAPGCIDFVVAADLLLPGRVNVFEPWRSGADLETFRGDGPPSEVRAGIVRSAGYRYHVTQSQRRIGSGPSVTVSDAVSIRVLAADEVRARERTSSPWTGVDPRAPLPAAAIAVPFIVDAGQRRTEDGHMGHP